MSNFITSKTFVDYFKDTTENKSATRFCFIVGAGASLQSGIPTGAQLAKDWFDKIKHRYQDSYKDWMTENKVDINDLPASYGNIYQKRFELDDAEGYEYLQRLMDKREPSFGYSILAQLLASHGHNIVITTNFDSLTEDALFYYTKTKPLICGHELLTEFVKPLTNRPLIAKLHRDLLLSPKNTNDETGTLPTSWAKALDGIFKDYIPVVIGYGGNDGSLMGYLDKVERKGIYWCTIGEKQPKKEIVALVERLKGKFVSISGFDELMYEISLGLNMKDLTEEITSVANEKSRQYIKQRLELHKKVVESNIKEDQSTKKAAIEKTTKTEFKDWWDVEAAALAEPDLDKKEKLYEEGIKLLDAPELYNSYARFLYVTRKDYDKAAINYQNAIDRRPNYVDALNNYATLLYMDIKDYDKAEFYYKKTIESDPNFALGYSNYAELLRYVRKDYNKAQLYFEKAIELESFYSDTYAEYASLLADVHKDYIKAEEYYLKGIQVEKNYAPAHYSYALFLQNTLNDKTKARTYFETANKLDPKFVIPDL